MTIQLDAIIWVYYTPLTGRVQAFTSDMGELLQGAVLIDKIPYTNTIDEADAANNSAKVLNAQADQILAIAYAEATQLREAAQSLLALPAA